MAQSEIRLPPGCLLRQANSSDLLDFKQLGRQNAFNNFRLLLAFLVGLNLLVIFVYLLTAWIIGSLFLFARNFKMILFLLGSTWVSFFFGCVLGFFTTNSCLDLSNTWIIKCQGQLVAWVTLRRSTKGSNILVLFVVKNWRKRGLGSALINHLIQEVSPPLSVICTDKLVSFYSRLGFVPSRSNIFGQYMVYKGLNLKSRPNKS